MQSTPFTKYKGSLADEVFGQLPLWCRLHILFAWAKQLALDEDDHDMGIVELIGSLTVLNFNNYLKIDQKFLSLLTSLPFSVRLAHLDLSQTPIGNVPELAKMLSHPIFQHLETLNLSQTGLQSLDPLLNDPPHHFPNLRVLDVSGNSKLQPLTTAKPNQFPNLKELNLRWAGNNSLENLHMMVFPPSTTSDTTSPIQPQPQFHLEKLSISGSSRAADLQILIPILRSPSLSQLSDLVIDSFQFDVPDVNALFHSDNGTLQHLKSLDLGLSCWANDDALRLFTQSPILSNLTTIKFFLDNGRTTFGLFPPGVESGSQRLVKTRQLLTPNLKHVYINGFSCPPLSSSDFAIAFRTPGLLLETFTMIDGRVPFPLDVLSTSPYVSPTADDNVPHNHIYPDEVWDSAIQQLAQSPNLSKLTSFALPQLNRPWTSHQILTLLTSPMMSNDLVNLDLSNCRDQILRGNLPSNLTDDVLETILRTRTIPTDPNSPLKYGKLKQLRLFRAPIGPRGIKAIVNNLPPLTELYIESCREVNDEAVTIIIGHEHDDLKHPLPALPNLTHLTLPGSTITNNSLIQLSKSQLLDQLEHLSLSSIDSVNAIGVSILLHHSKLFSNIKMLQLPVPRSQLGSRPLPHLDNCYIDCPEIYNDDDDDDQDGEEEGDNDWDGEGDGDDE